MPRNEWPDIIQNLVNNTANENTLVKDSAITTLGFICEHMKDRMAFIDPAGLETIFGGIIVGLTDKDLNIKKTSLTALHDSLSSGKGLFDTQKVREFTLNQISEMILNEPEE